ncbi:MAG: type III-A CRISPR-associated RAMP protein Csm3 [Gemmatimonadetes bacterium]|jgi:CRISPR-associated protein Csm3|nr:type III-A CRISPR-associated RAMP protein Csm3 [Gemmatimonadota bacterium]
MRKKSHYVITGTIELKSGTRIGGSDDILQIGGTDLTCIKDPVTGKPYIPGSSLKGKMRSELEKYHGRFGRNNPNEPCGCAQENCPVCRVFGPHKKVDHGLGPTRILVRDAPLLEGGEIELKSETAIARTSGAAQRGSLRTLERVVPGSKFALEIGLQVFDLDEKFTYEDEEENTVQGGAALYQVVCHGLDLIEQTGIGGGTSKGYGAVEITIEKAVEVKRRKKCPQPSASAE